MYIVTKSTGSWYELLDEATGQRARARLRGAIRLRGARSTNPVVVGDRVETEGGDNQNCPEGGDQNCPASDDLVITDILPRKNYIIRRASNLSKESHILAANIDRVYIVATVSFPATAPEFIDRVLVTAELYSVPATILVNKSDIEADDYLTPIYQMAGYSIIPISAVSGLNIERLRTEIAGKTVLLTGNSGVGKSTLINALDPTLNARTGDISAAHMKGKHTTTFSEIFPFAGGYLIDTPGVKGFGLLDIDSRELYRSFPDMMRYAPQCRYYNCSHTHEPDCAVVEAVEQGQLHPSRYESYLKMLEQDGTKYR